MSMSEAIDPENFFCPDGCSFAILYSDGVAQYITDDMETKRQMREIFASPSAKNIIAVYSSEIKHIPYNIKNLTSLKYATFHSTYIDFEAIATLPIEKLVASSFDYDSIDCIGELKNLKHLEFYYFGGYENTDDPDEVEILELPETLGKLKNLETISIMDCKVVLPVSIEDIQSLKNLEIHQSEICNITDVTLPASIEKLNLRMTFLDGWTSCVAKHLVNLKEFRVSIHDYHPLNQLPKLTHYKQLEVLEISNDLDELNINDIVPLEKINFLKELTVDFPITFIPSSVKKFNVNKSFNCAVIPEDIEELSTGKYNFTESDLDKIINIHKKLTVLETFDTTIIPKIFSSNLKTLRIYENVKTIPREISTSSLEKLFIRSVDDNELIMPLFNKFGKEIEVDIIKGGMKIKIDPNCTSIGFGAKNGFVVSKIDNYKLEDDATCLITTEPIAPNSYYLMCDHKHSINAIAMFKWINQSKKFDCPYCAGKLNNCIYLNE